MEASLQKRHTPSFKEPGKQGDTKLTGHRYRGKEPLNGPCSLVKLCGPSWILSIVRVEDLTDTWRAWPARGFVLRVLSQERIDFAC